MESGGGSYDQKLEEVFYFYLRRVEDFDTVARKAPYETIGPGHVDILALSFEDQYAEFVGVPKNGIYHTPAYEGLETRARQLDDWTASIEPFKDEYVEAEEVEGQIWISEEVEKETSSKFFDHVLGVDIAEILEPVDREALDL